MLPLKSSFLPTLDDALKLRNQTSQLRPSALTHPNTAPRLGCTGHVGTLSAPLRTSCSLRARRLRCKAWRLRRRLRCFSRPGAFSCRSETGAGDPRRRATRRGRFAIQHGGSLELCFETVRKAISVQLEGLNRCRPLSLGSEEDEK